MNLNESNVKDDKTIFITKLDKVLLDKKEREENNDIDKIKMALRYSRLSFLSAALLLIVSIYFLTASCVRYNTDKLVVLREHFANNYYKQDDLKEKK